MTGPHSLQQSARVMAAVEREMLAAVGGIAGHDAVVTVLNRKPWASATFHGSRIDCTIENGRDGWREEIQQIGEMNFDGMIVVDVEVNDRNVSLLTIADERNTAAMERVGL